jgi:diguanylate cyclase (GGDEF)-like protein
MQIYMRSPCLLFMELLKIELNRFQRHAPAASLLMLDIDHFKIINDTYGHITGDKVLQHFSNVVEKNLRNFDILGRFGGEEFCILLPATDMAGGQQFAERLCQIIAATPIETNNFSIAYSVSIGVTMFLPGDNKIINIIERADTALYQAKTAGRNCAISSLIPVSQRLSISL